MKKYDSPTAVKIDLSTGENILNGSENKTLGDMLDTTDQLDVVDFVNW